MGVCLFVRADEGGLTRAERKTGRARKTRYSCVEISVAAALAQRMLQVPPVLSLRDHAVDAMLDAADNLVLLEDVL
eukprot:355101-Chlamydomonas_euryale.AAC.8